MRYLASAFFIVALSILTSCEKADTIVPLPARGDAEYGEVEMGEDYTDQVFYDFESRRVVHMSKINSWHLAFEASADGYHVFMNGGADVMCYNTGSTSFSDVGNAPSANSKQWKYDAPSLLPDSTGFGDWRASGQSLSQNQVYIIKLNPTNNPDNIKKLRIIAVTDKSYTIEYGDINELDGHILTIPKNYDYNYAYFSFDNNGYTLQPDPPKDSWDIVFTRYRIIYYHLDNFPYQVNGVLINPYKTKAARDTITAFSEMNNANINALNFTDHRNIIGYDWKVYNFDKERYEIDQKKVFVIHNRRDQYWKLRFTDFYNASGIKGCPSFEFQRIN